MYPVNRCARRDERHELKNKQYGKRMAGFEVCNQNGHKVTRHSLCY